MGERQLWAEVASQAIRDHAKMIEAAREGRRVIVLDGDSGQRLIGTTEEEIERARSYFTGSDWREVADCAGLNVGVEQIMSALDEGPRSYSVSHRIAGPRTEPTVYQGAA